jgi:hypothetical protein
MKRERRANNETLTLIAYRDYASIAGERLGVQGEAPVLDEKAGVELSTSSWPKNSRRRLRCSPNIASYVIYLLFVMPVRWVLIHPHI